MVYTICQPQFGRFVVGQNQSRGDEKPWRPTEENWALFLDFCVDKVKDVVRLESKENEECSMFDLFYLDGDIFNFILTFDEKCIWLC